MKCKCCGVDMPLKHKEQPIGICSNCQQKRPHVKRLIRAGEPLRKLRKREQNKSHQLYLAELLRECGINEKRAAKTQQRTDRRDTQ